MLTSEWEASSPRVPSKATTSPVPASSEPASPAERREPGWPSCTETSAVELREELRKVDAARAHSAAEAVVVVLAHVVPLALLWV